MDVQKFFGFFKGAFQDDKRRVLVMILSAVIALSAAFVLYYSLGGGATEPGVAKVPAVNAAQGETLPEAKQLSKQYLQALLQSEQQTAEQAQQQGKSALPTLIRTGQVQTPSTSTMSQADCCRNCLACCENQKDATVLLNNLSEQGAISPVVAAELSKLQDDNVSPDDYAARLNELVREGKLTPEQAKQLLAAYRAKHEAAAAAEASHTPGSLANELLASGDVSADTAKALRDLSSQSPSAEDYQSSLDDLVAQGKLTPEQAKRLMAAYQAKLNKAAPPAAKVTTEPSGDLVSQMKNVGQLSEAGADDLQRLEDKQMPAAVYAARLNQLIQSGQLTPDQAKKLLAAYRAQYGDTSVTSKDPNAADSQRNQQLSDLQQQIGLMDQQASAVTQQQTVEAQTAQQNRVQALQSAMSNQAQALLASWNAVPQSYVRTALVEDNGDAQSKTKSSRDASASDNASGGGDNSAVVALPLVKAGSIVFAVLDTAINSDQPGPIMATIVSGKLKGAKLMGGINATTDGQRVVLSFNSVTMPTWPDVVSINAVAINPDTAHTAIASSVDNHYLLRYGSLFAASFLSGYSQALQQSGSTSVNNAGTTTQTNPTLDARARIWMGFGEIANQMSGPIKDTFSRPPTVKVDAGVGIGVLFMSSLKQPTF